jgi:hypothetical protein
MDRTVWLSRASVQRYVERLDVAGNLLAGAPLPQQCGLTSEDAALAGRGRRQAAISPFALHDGAASGGRLRGELYDHAHDVLSLEIWFRDK